MKLYHPIGKAFTSNRLSICAILFLSVLPNYPLQAQIVPDTTLPINSLVTPNTSAFTIDGGTTDGSNLFHSFSQFSVPAGSEAFFNNALDIQNIISRVTGSSISSINGSIRANGSANLFLINPNGIIFGPNALLNIGGSFLGTTANSLNFADGTIFPATNPQVLPLLTVSVPVGLGFGGNPGAIRVQGTGHSLTVADQLFSPIIGAGSSTSGLRVQPGKTLALVGGNISLDGGILTAPEGRIELGSVASGSVSLNPTASGWTLSYPGVQNFRDIQLSQRALADASGNLSGSIQVQSANVMLTDGSVILTQNQGSQSTAPTNKAGSISVNASQSLNLSGISSDAIIASGVFNQNVGSGKQGDISVSTQRLVIQDGGVIQERTFQSGQGGDVNINASDSVQLLGASSLNPTAFSQIAASTLGSGDAGKINLSTKQLTAVDGGIVISATTGTGKGGEVIVNADSIELIGIQPTSFGPSAISSTTLNSGNAGSVTIKTQQLVIRDGGSVDSSTLAGGNAGSITVKASDVEVTGSFPGSVNSSQISSAGKLLDPVLQQLLGLPPLSGNSGDVTINTTRLSVTDQGQVTVRNDGTGEAGILTVNARSIFLDNQGALTAVSGKSGEGENEASITLNVQNSLRLRRNSLISAEARGEQKGGNITINAGAIAAIPRENSDITARAPQGTGGRVIINAQGIFGLQVNPSLTPKSDITAEGKTPELNGVVQINIPNINLQSVLNQQEANFVTPEQAIASSCLARRNAQQGSFTVTGTGGLPVTPYDALQSQYAVTNVQPLGKERGTSSAPLSSPSRQASSPKSWKLGDPIQEAQGMTLSADGRLIVGTASQLVAAAQAKDLVCYSSAP
jgi:filamentous hemagglutinin family protein